MRQRELFLVLFHYFQHLMVGAALEDLDKKVLKSFRHLNIYNSMTTEEHQQQ